jgi:hypothetical protein
MIGERNFHRSAPLRQMIMRLECARCIKGRIKTNFSMNAAIVLVSTRVGGYDKTSQNARRFARGLPSPRFQRPASARASAGAKGERAAISAPIKDGGKGKRKKHSASNLIDGNA